MAKISIEVFDDKFFEKIKNENGGKPPVLLGSKLEFTKENYKKIQEEGLAFWKKKLGNK